MSDAASFLSDLQMRMETHRIATFIVDFHRCTLRAHAAQRELDTDHVEKLYETFKDGIDRQEPLIAIFHGQRSQLPGPGSHLHDISLSIIGGQHRVNALLKLEEDTEKWWTAVLYDEAIERDSGVNLESYAMSMNKDEGTVKRKVTTPLDWFYRLLKCKHEAELEENYPFLPPETKKHLKPMFKYRKAEVEVLRIFVDKHPSFIKHMSFHNLKARAGCHLLSLDVEYLKKILEFWNRVDKNGKLYDRLKSGKTINFKFIEKSRMLYGEEDFKVVIDGPNDPSIQIWPDKAWPFKCLPVPSVYTGNLDVFQRAAGARNVLMQITLEKHSSSYTQKNPASEFHAKMEPAGDLQFQIECLKMAIHHATKVANWSSVHKGFEPARPISDILNGIRDLANNDSHFKGFLASCPHSTVQQFHHSLVEREGLQTQSSTVDPSLAGGVTIAQMLGSTLDPQTMVNEAGVDSIHNHDNGEVDVAPQSLTPVTSATGQVGGSVTAPLTGSLSTASTLGNSPPAINLQGIDSNMASTSSAGTDNIDPQLLSDPAALAALIGIDPNLLFLQGNESHAMSQIPSSAPDVAGGRADNSGSEELSEDCSEYAAPLSKKTPANPSKKTSTHSKKTDKWEEELNETSTSSSPQSLEDQPGHVGGKRLPSTQVARYRPQERIPSLLQCLDSTQADMASNLLHAVSLLDPELRIPFLKLAVDNARKWLAHSGDMDWMPEEERQTEEEWSTDLESPIRLTSGRFKRKRDSFPGAERPLKRIKAATSSGDLSDGSQGPTGPPAEEIDNEVWEKMLDEIERSSQILYVIGAGVSAGAGLPTFREASGRRTPSTRIAFNGTLFRRHDNEAVQALWEFAENVLIAREKERPLFHRVLSQLFDAHRLGAIVSTNVDGLETDKRVENFLPESKVLRLHGRIYELECKGHTAPLTVEMARALAKRELVELPNCSQCTEEGMKANERGHLKRRTAKQQPPAPAMRFFDDYGDLQLGDEEHTMFSDIFGGKLTPDLVFIIGSSLRSQDLRKALHKVKESATTYIVDSSPNQHHREFEDAITIHTTAEKWAARVDAHLNLAS